MLSVGDETLWKNGEELTHLDVFPFLYDCYLVNPAAAYVGFFLGYDFTMWLKSLTEHQAFMLFTSKGQALRKRKESKNPTPFPVHIDGWEVDMLGMRRFKLRPHSEDKPAPWLYICDTGAYFQTSFINVINPKGWENEPVCSAKEFAIICEGKNKRGNDIEPGDLCYLSDMVQYNRLENRVLSRVMRTLNNGFVAAGVRLSRSSFYGPGQAIQGWLDGLVKQGAYLPHKYVEEDVPSWVLSAFQASYYGGRFEITRHGLLPGATYEYDITSAYPHAMRSLPCLCSGKWRRGLGKTNPNSGIVLCRGLFSAVQTSLGGLPFRNPKGNILFPTSGIVGWYLLSEIDAARRASLIDASEIYEWIAFEQTCNHPSPLAALGDLFYTRLKIGKSTPQGKAIKLMINSAYGKFAQSIGHPKYGNPIYASMITSKCREMILDAIATHPCGYDSVVMIATDGIYFNSTHPILDAMEGKEQLGGWEPGIKTNITLMKPGVYWDDKARKALAEGNTPALRSRGISAQALADNIDRIDHEFSEWHKSLDTTPSPSLDVRVNFSITTPSLALARGKWGTCGFIEWNGTRHESAAVTPKRRSPYLDNNVIRSHTPDVPHGTESTPYQKDFGFDLANWGIDQEGYLDDTIHCLTKPDEMVP